MDHAPNLSRRKFLQGRTALGPGIRPPGVSRGRSRCLHRLRLLRRSLSDRHHFTGSLLSNARFHRWRMHVLRANARKACPEPVFSADPPRRFPHVAAISESCFAKSGIACQSCRDACPEQAIRFSPRIGGPFVPELDEDACSGCGACISVCPAGAIGVSERGKADIHA